jgi:hypothetical protein
VNRFLQKYHLYTCAANDCNNLILKAPEAISPFLRLVGEINPPPFAEVAQGLDAGNVIYLAHVHNCSHFVLVTGYDATNQRLIVQVRFSEGSGVEVPWRFFNCAATSQDPFYAVESYDYAGVADFIAYDVLPAGANTSVVATAYPLYDQCNPAWGSDLMYNETICEVGCLMTSIATALAGKGLLINGVVSTPATFNTWLRNEGGYDDHNDLQEEVVPKMNPKNIAWPVRFVAPRSLPAGLSTHPPSVARHFPARMTPSTASRT